MLPPLAAQRESLKSPLSTDYMMNSDARQTLLPLTRVPTRSPDARMQAASGIKLFNADHLR